MQNRAVRVLILGVGVLKDFKIDEFRSVLAHEYGHFSNRDTAGGDVALRVRNDILKFYYAMREAGQATNLNLAFHFLRFYNFLFHRISSGATRLQEILADRVAAQNYGAAAFEGGLRHVIRRSIELDRNADEAVKTCIEAKSPLCNFYDADSGVNASVEKDLDASINRETSRDDTHPSPKERFRLVSQLKNPTSAPLDGEVWSLFRDRDGITREMIAEVEKNVSPHRGLDDPNALARA
jgi:Zn-dependent protease with chaperone function